MMSYLVIICPTKNAQSQFLSLQEGMYSHNYLRNSQTRLLAHPQPQMYPPVALNQYTWVNITHKHFIYTVFQLTQFH